ncbi:MAG TPA: hypothetical protein VF705_01595, partial [Longimicrobium sp.]
MKAETEGTGGAKRDSTTADASSAGVVASHEKAPAQKPVPAPKAGGGLKPVTVRVFRFNPETDAEPKYLEFQVQVDPTDRVLDAL